MTMSSAVSKVTLNGDGVQTSWPFSFKVWKADDLEVILTSPGGTESVTTDWTVVLAGTGGTVTYPILGDTLPTGWKITIRRSMDFLQEVDLVSGTRWDPEVIETALDIAAAERQQLLEEISRSVRIGVASTEDPTQVVNQVFTARDQAAASAGAAATSESNAATSAAEAQLASSQIGVLTAEGTLTTGQDTITLPFAYDFENEALAVYLGGARQNKASLTFVDAYTVVLDTPVAADTDYIAASLTLEGESLLTELRDDAVAAQASAEAARDTVLSVGIMPIGSIITVTGTSPAPGTVAAEGQLLSRAAYPDLWVFAQASGNISVDDASWTKGQYSPGDGSTTFRVPNLQDQFIRGASSTRAVGNGEEDAFQGHWHSATGSAYSLGGGIDDTAARATAKTHNDIVRNPISDGINGTPRTADETRPKNVAYLICIKAYDVISDPNVLNAVEVVNSIAANAVEVVNSIAAVGARVTPCLSADEYIHIRDEKPSGTSGGSTSSATWHTRDLNTVKTNTIAGATLTSNKIALPEGRYYISASAPAAAVTRHRIALYDVTNSTYTMLGVSCHTPSSGGDSTSSTMVGMLDIPAGREFEVRTYCTAAYPTNGLGFPVTISGQPEIYTVVEIWKIG